MTEEKIFEDRAQHYGNSGINFDAYEDIPVQVRLLDYGLRLY